MCWDTNTSILSSTMYLSVITCPTDVLQVGYSHLSLYHILLMTQIDRYHQQLCTRHSYNADIARGVCALESSNFHLACTCVTKCTHQHNPRALSTCNHLFMGALSYIITCMGTFNWKITLQVQVVHLLEAGTWVWLIWYIIIILLYSY